MYTFNLFVELLTRTFLVSSGRLTLSMRGYIPMTGPVKLQFSRRWIKLREVVRLKTRDKFQRNVYENVEVTFVLKFGCRLHDVGLTLLSYRQCVSMFLVLGKAANLG